MENEAKLAMLRGERCQFQREIEGLGWIQCDRTDTENVDMWQDHRAVFVCPEHRSWLPAMGRSNG